MGLLNGASGEQLVTTVTAPASMAHGTRGDECWGSAFSAPRDRRAVQRQAGRRAGVPGVCSGG